MSDAASLWGIAAVATLLVLAAYLSVVETVLARLPLVRALRLREEESEGAEALLWLLEHRATSLNVVLVLTTTLRTATAAIVTWLAFRLAGGPLAVVLSLAALVMVSLVLAEVAPRTLALRHLEAWALRLAGSFRVLTGVTEPLASGVVAVGRGLVRERTDAAGPFATDDDGRDTGTMQIQRQDDELEDDERAMIHSIFELGDTVVREIMVPRPDMVTVAADAPLRDLVNTIIEHGYSRIPVHRDTKDDLVGVVFAKDVLMRLAHQPGVDSWDDLVREPTFVPESKQVDELLRFLQEQAVHQAIVVDEYGALTGLVTIEDILEEIVGEIVDEHDREDPLVEMLDDDRMRVDARLPVDDLNELLDSDLPEEGWDTVGGLVVGMLGRVPQAGEQLDIDGVSIRTERVQGRRVSKVLVSRRGQDDGDGRPPAAGSREVVLDTSSNERG